MRCLRWKQSLSFLPQEALTLPGLSSPVQALSPECSDSSGNRMSERRLQLWPPGGGRWPRSAGPGLRTWTGTARGLRGCGWRAEAVARLHRLPEGRWPGPRHSESGRSEHRYFTDARSRPGPHSQHPAPSAWIPRRRREALPFPLWFVSPRDGAGALPPGKAARKSQAPASSPRTSPWVRS